MSRHLFDTALADKIRPIIKDPNLTFTGVDDTTTLFTTTADKSPTDTIKFPLIALSRSGDMTIKNTNKRTASHKGMAFVKNHETGLMETMTFVEVSFTYQLDVYTRKRVENDDYIRELIFYFINNPKLKLDIPYNSSQRTLVSNVFLQPSVPDNSNVPEHLITGEYFRQSLSLSIPDAKLINYVTKDMVELQVELEE